MKSMYGCCYEANRQGMKCPIHGNGNKRKKDFRTVEIEKTIVDFLSGKPERTASYKEIESVVDKKFGVGYCRNVLTLLMKEKELYLAPRQYHLKK